MSLVFRNTQQHYKVNVKRLTHCAEFLRQTAGVGQYHWSIWLTNNKRIAKYNQIYRQKEGPTDVLSIAPQRVTPGMLPPPVLDGRKVLGDCVISVEYVDANGQQLGRTVTSRLERLVS